MFLISFLCIPHLSRFGFTPGVSGQESQQRTSRLEDILSSDAVIATGILSDPAGKIRRKGYECFYLIIRRSTFTIFSNIIILSNIFLIIINVYFIFYYIYFDLSIHLFIYSFNYLSMNLFVFFTMFL